MNINKSSSKDFKNMHLWKRNLKLKKNDDSMDLWKIWLDFDHLKVPN
jgi:hypothetical protein